MTDSPPKKPPTPPPDRDRILAVFVASRAIMAAPDVAEALDDGRSGNELGYRLRAMALAGDLVCAGRAPASQGRVNLYHAASVRKPRPWKPVRREAAGDWPRVVEVDIGDCDETGTVAWVVQVTGRSWLGCRGALVRTQGDARRWCDPDEAGAALRALVGR